jgi:hypothetical protein
MRPEMDGFAQVDRSIGDGVSFVTAWWVSLSERDWSAELNKQTLS